MDLWLLRVGSAANLEMYLVLDSAWRGLQVRFLPAWLPRDWGGSRASLFIRSKKQSCPERRMLGSAHGPCRKSAREVYEIFGKDRI